MTQTPGQYKVIEHTWEDTSIVGKSGKTLCHFSIHDLGRVTESNQDNLESVQRERVDMVLNAINSHTALVEALELAKRKLQLYRAQHSGGYIGGMEYLRLMDTIDKALQQAEGGV